MIESHARFARKVAPGTNLYRVHRRRSGSVAFFDISTHGRFNLTDLVGRGTCYLALEPLGAYLETLGRVLTRSRTDLADREYSVVTLDRVLSLFDLTRSDVRSAYRSEGLDLTATISGGDDYSDSQRLSRLAHDDGYDGIVYKARHDPGCQYESVALFGPAGSNEHNAVFATCATTAIPEELVKAGTDTFGIVVLPDPPA